MSGVLSPAGALIPGPRGGGRRRWPWRRPRGWAALLLFAAAAVAVALVVTAPLQGKGPATGNAIADNGYPIAYVTVKRQPLSAQTQVGGTLGYPGSSTVYVPQGSAPSAMARARQALATAAAMVRADENVRATDGVALGLTRASLAAMRAKEAVDCAGTGAAQTGTGSGSGSGGSSCANDAQAATMDEQAVNQAQDKVIADGSPLAMAGAQVAAAQASLAQAASVTTAYGTGSTFTELPAPGRVITRGRSLYGIDGHGVALLYGPVLAARAFFAGMSPGPDVAELNANLDALGDGRALTGDAFTSRTTAAIEAFQAARSLAPTGDLPLGSVVFEAGPVRVTSVRPALGVNVRPGPVLDITSATRQVTIELAAADQSSVKVGDPITITLPDNRTTPGRVISVSTVASSGTGGAGGAGGGSGPTVTVHAVPTDPSATGSLDQAPVEVSITTASVADTLVVPVTALLALAGGGYAVEEVGAGGLHHLVAVDIGLFDDADGLVQVSGHGLATGQRVVVPNA